MIERQHLFTCTLLTRRCCSSAQTRNIPASPRLPKKRETGKHVWRPERSGAETPGWPSAERRSSDGGEGGEEPPHLHKHLSRRELQLDPLEQEHSWPKRRPKRTAQRSPGPHWDRGKRQKTVRKQAGNSQKTGRKQAGNREKTGRKQAENREETGRNQSGTSQGPVRNQSGSSWNSLISVGRCSSSSPPSG